MPQSPGVHSKSKRAGQFQRSRPRIAARPPPVLSFRVSLPPDDGRLVFWWDRGGTLYLDEEMTRPADLTIVRLVDDDDDDD